MALYITNNGVRLDLPATNSTGNTRTNYTLIQALQGQIDLFNQNVIIVNNREDFPQGNPIQLEDYHTYIVTTDVDLNGDRIVGGINSVLIGYSSENCSLTSIGLTDPLITSNYTLPIRNITIKDVDIALDLDGDSNTMALDWFGVNFENVPTIGTIKNISNFVFNQGAFLNSQGLTFDGSADTISIAYSLLSGTGNSGSIITIPSTAVINRRFRITYSAIVATNSTTAFNVSTSSTIPDEAYILDTVNFSGNGTYLTGLNQTYNKAYFVACRGIKNTSVNGQVYMRSNVTTTPISVSGTYYKVLGTTSNSADNSKVTTSDNRITIDAVVSRVYRIDCTLSFNSGNNNVCSFGFYDSQLGSVRQPSITFATANTAGRAENVSFFCYANREQLDYFEVHCTNHSSTSSITVTDMNFSVTELK